MLADNTNNFRFLGTVDTEFFSKVIDTLNWNDYTERQEQRFGMQDTFTIPLIWDMKLEQALKWPTYQLLKTELVKIEQALAGILGKGSSRTIVLTKLPAGTQIDLHKDKGKFFQNTNRIHIPVTTNDKCIFRVGQETKNMKVGENVDNHFIE